MEFTKNEIIGSKLSVKDKEYYSRLNEMDFYPLFLELFRNSLTLNTSEKREFDSLYTLIKYYQLNYAYYQNDIYGYSRFLDVLELEKDERSIHDDTIQFYLQHFQSQFKGHPYNTISEIRFENLNKIYTGGEYINFSARDASGEIIEVSNIISNNKFTLIDMWAPWCGPCIKKSRMVIPIYNMYRENGFDVVGYVGGIEKREDFLKAANRHKYPWIVLSDINETKLIWEKYGLTNSGGSQFLIDNNGKIIFINPTPSELENILGDI